MFAVLPGRFGRSDPSIVPPVPRYMVEEFSKSQQERDYLEKVRFKDSQNQIHDLTSPGAGGRVLGCF